ncbi:MAG: response regulator transcription factor [Candidatus Aminicenantales bacterium]
MNPRRVIIVDDDLNFCRCVKEYLADKPDFTVVGEIRDGRQALEQVETLRPDLVLMDARMPGMDGFTASRLLLKKRPDLRIIILTVFNNLEYRKSAQKSGVSGYLVKSDIVKDLMPTIRRAFKRRAIKVRRHEHKK